MKNSSLRVVGLTFIVESLESRRLLASGLDPTFGVGGIVTPQADGNSVTTDTMLLESGTQFLVLGHTTGSNPLYLIRYQPSTGQSQTMHLTDARLANLKGIDSTNVPARDQCFLARQSSGKIILAGRTDSTYVVARFNADGTLDSSFASNGVATIARPRAATTLAVLLNACVSSDDKITLITRQGESVQGGTANLVVFRLTAGGALDNSYGTNGMVMTPDSSDTFDLWPTRAALEPDGKIITAGDTDSGYPIFQFVARYNADLSIDTTFGDKGVAAVPRVQNSGQLMAMALAPDGKILVAGVAELSRYNADGSPDTSFDSDGHVLLESAAPPLSGIGQLIPEAGGKVTVLFDSANYGTYTDPVRLARFNANGSLDSTFGAGGQSSLAPVMGADHSLSAVELDDGRVALINGESVALSGQRLDFDLGPNGTLFVSGTGSADNISITASGNTLHAIRNGVEKTWPLANVKRLDIASDAGNDVILDSVAIPALIDASAGNDSITLTGAQAATLSAGDGNDTVLGSEAADSIDGGAGDDSIDAGAGNDTVNDDSGVDSVMLGDGNDLFQGHDTSSDAKLIDAGAGDDAIHNGSRGAATILGGSGNDFISGGGNTTLQVDAGDGDDLLSVLGFTSGTVILGNGNDVVTTQAKSVEIFGGAGNDLIKTNTDGGSASIYGEDGIDTITASLGNDLIVGGANKDHISAGGGNDTIRGFGGNDRIGGGDGDDLICGAAGNDRIDGGAGLDTVYGGEGDDSISAGANKDFIYAGNGNDTVRGYGGNDQIFGQGGDDSLWGNPGNDRLDGGDGNDWLSGDAGSNRLSGNAGDDLFQADNSAPDTLDGGDGANRGTFDKLLDTIVSVVPA